MKHNWEYKRLGDICDLYQPKTISSSDLVGNGIYDVFGANGIIGKYIAYNHEYPEILLTCRGATCGTINVSNPKSWINGNAMVIHGKSSSIVFNYLRYAMMALDYSNIITGAAQPQITRQSLSPINIPVPPLEVQEQIVAELDKINEVIADCRELLCNLDTLAQSIFYDTFGDPVTNPKGWERSPLKDAVIEMFLGPFGSALKTDCYIPKEDGYAMVYEQKHAIKKTLNQENHYIDKAKFESLKRFEILPNDFIMSCRGTIGQLYQVPNDSPRGIIHPSVMKIRLNPSKYNASFFKFLLPVIVKEQQTKGNCVQMAITAKELGAKKLPVPPLKLQEIFASRIERIEEQKKAVEATIAELQTLLDSRMDYWFN